MYDDATTLYESFECVPPPTDRRCWLAALTRESFLACAPRHCRCVRCVPAPLAHYFAGTACLRACAHRRGVRLAGPRPCLGWRVVKPDNTAGPFAWLTYAQVAKRRTDFGSGLMHLNLVEPNSEGVRDRGRCCTCRPVFRR